MKKQEQKGIKLTLLLLLWWPAVNESPASSLPTTILLTAGIVAVPIDKAKTNVHAQIDNRCGEHLRKHMKP